MTAEDGHPEHVRPHRKLMVVLHGANLNMLGERSREHYGEVTLSELEQMVAEVAEAHGWDCVCYQTNHEGEFIELLHRYRRADAVLLNPGAWTHYSYAIRDALELVRCPTAEVHLSAIDRRESWRSVSVIGDLVAIRIWGKGPAGYREAAERLIQMAERGDYVPSPGGGRASP